MGAKKLGFSKGRLKRIDDWMARNREIGRYHGSSLLIARHGEVAHTCVDEILDRSLVTSHHN